MVTEQMIESAKSLMRLLTSEQPPTWGDYFVDYLRAFGPKVGRAVKYANACVQEGE